MLSLNLVLNIEMKSFRICSACDPLIFPKHAKPSSRYKPMLNFLPRREEYIDLLASKS